MKRLVIVCMILIFGAVMLDSFLAVNAPDYPGVSGSNPSICDIVVASKIVKVTTNPNTVSQTITQVVSNCKWDGTRGDGLVNAYTTVKCTTGRNGNQMSTPGMDVACAENEVCVLQNSNVQKVDNQGNPLYPPQYIWIPKCQKMN